MIPDEQIDCARAVRIEDEIARRGISLRGGVDRCGPCPVCGGTDRFSINVKKQVWNCRGCSRGGDVIALVQFLDKVDFMEAVETLAGGPFKSNDSGRKTYFDYCDPTTGAVKYRKERIERENGTKELFFNPRGRGGSAPLLYGGDRLADIAEDQPVFIVEGEKMVDRLRELGAVAVSGDTGWTSKWLPAHADLLRGLHIVLWPDSDEDGEKYISRAAACLNDSAASLRVVRPFGPPNGAKGLDVCDWNGNGEDLATLVAAAEPYVAEARPNGAKAPTFPLIAWKDVAFDLEEEWLVDRVFPLIGLACLYGGPGSVKTFILLDLFARMARGGFWGAREVKQCPAVYIAAEGGNGIKKRIAAMKKIAAEKGLPADIPFHLITVAPNLGMGAGDCKKLIADIEATGVRPGAIAIDTTTQALGGGDENGDGMDQLVVNATAISAKFQCLVVLVHHTPVADDDRLRGKSSLLGGLDVSIISKREKGSFVAALTIKKMRDEDETQSFTVNLVRVVLGRTKNGREVSTLVVETVDPSAETDKKPKSGKKLPPCAANALSALRYAIDQVGQPAPASNHIPKGRTVVSENQWKNYATVRSLKDNPDSIRKEFVRGVERLLAEELIGIWDTYIWEA